jgi:hypothetical protein
MEVSLENVKLAMQVQANVQKKAIDHQAGLILKLVESVAEQDKNKIAEAKATLKPGQIDLLA